MTILTQQALGVRQYSFFAVSTVTLLISLGCTTNRPFEHILGSVTVRQAYLNNSTILDATCTVADIRSRQEGYSRRTTFKIDLQVTTIVKGQFDGKTIQLRWWRKDRIDPKVAHSIAYNWREGGRWRLFFDGTRNGQPYDLKVTTLDEGERWAARDVDWNRKRLTDAAPSVRIEAIKILTQYGTKAHVALPDIRRLIGDQVREVREASRQALEALGEVGAE